MDNKTIPPTVNDEALTLSRDRFDRGGDVRLHQRTTLLHIDQVSDNRGTRVPLAEEDEIDWSRSECESGE